MNYSLLAAILVATAETGFKNITLDADTAELESLGYIEINPHLPDGPAARVTDAGKAASAASNGFVSSNAPVAQTTPAATTASKPVFERVRMQAPAVTPRKPGAVAGTETYPFSTLAPKDAQGNCDGIFVSPNASMSDPGKSLASAVSAANRRFAIVTGTRMTKPKAGKPAEERNVYEFVREFRLYPSTDAAHPGAWILRVDDGSHPFASHVLPYNDEQVAGYLRSKTGGQPQS